MGVEVPAQLPVAMWKGSAAFGSYGLHRGPGQIWLTICRPVKGSGDEGPRVSEAPSVFGLLAYLCVFGDRDPTPDLLFLRTPQWLCY